MTVVKADGYGHGMVEVARAAREAGADWLGVATIDEALALRAAGDTGRLLCWLTVPGEDCAAAIAADVDVTAYSVAELDEIAAAVAVAGRPARVQLKVDTGLSRGGAPMADWPALVAAARAGEEDGTWRVTGIWSHFAASDEPDHPANDAQEAVFREALAIAEEAGLRPEVRHLANSAAAHPAPVGPVRPGPLRARVVRPRPRARPHPRPRAAPGDDRARHARPGQAARRRRLASPTATPGPPTPRPRVGLVPVGYGDGVPAPRQQRAPRSWSTASGAPIRGRVCMDQFVVDLGGDLPPRRQRRRAVRPRARTASRPPRTGPRPAAPSPTRSSPGIGGRMTRRYVDR